ncbi:hypothetical protein BUE76_10990 [Cnuella takakiae]|nr:hypothetical protein BUE76_10990 [Cnuella takakiae]
MSVFAFIFSKEEGKNKAEKIVYVLNLQLNLFCSRAAKVAQYIGIPVKDNKNPPPKQGIVHREV